MVKQLLFFDHTTKFYYPRRVSHSSLIQNKCRYSVFKKLFTTAVITMLKSTYIQGVP